MLTAHTDIAECQHPVFLTSFSRWNPHIMLAGSTFVSSVGGPTFLKDETNSISKHDSGFHLRSLVQSTLELAGIIYESINYLLL